LESKRQLKESYREVRTGWRARDNAKSRTGRFALVGELEAMQRDVPGGSHWLES